MEEKKDEILFEIQDDSLILEQITIIVIGISFLIMMWIFGIGEGLELSKGHIFNRITGTSVCLATIFFGLFKISKVRKQDRKIIFFNNRITKINNHKTTNIDFFNEIYKHNFIGVGADKIRRYSVFKKNIAMIFMPIGIFVIYFVQIINYFAVIIHARKIIFPIYSIILIKDNDLEKIVIPFIFKQEEMKNYFLKYYNIDIQKLKTTWFIPVIKNKKG